ncbi:HIT family protein [Sulfuriferula sp.]|uniref:HIT family protein n=1 Tax=Sulfuriferula sp. TaxID=2025307 RepID=UPI000ED25C6F|nr:HIT family protein [Sulfuriferula sp.]MDP2027430.1 HIT family protein [Sulfuriferula sp.]HAN55148.1 HIT family protein [Betaproteobacteria bacterium]
MDTCELCTSLGGEVLWQDAFCRVVLVDDADYPGFCRVILQEHVKEMSDLSAVQQSRLMRVVFATEAAVRQVLKPDKINLASLGNLTPHLHWHVIPRFVDDRHFPQPIWAAAQRAARPQAQLNLIASVLKSALAQKL